MPKTGNSKCSMQIEKRINALVQLGKILKQEAQIENPDLFEKSKAHNGWFTASNIQYALKQWGALLTQKGIEKWIGNYNLTSQKVKTIAIVMAGNIPLVGFHDFISVLLSGHKALVKLSSNDTILLPYIAAKLIAIEPTFEDSIEFTDGTLENFDAVIATGSNNTALYFEHYFGKYPHIIRKNRNSVAILTGNESVKQLELLATDIFQYFGLGCRNVSKIYLPKGYDFTNFFQAMFHWKDLINHVKYMNNYDYNKAVYLMSNISLLDNEFMLLKEEASMASPIAVVFYEYYDNQESLARIIAQNSDQIQCIVSEQAIENAIPFGETQHPQLWDYADGVDTLAFLVNL